MTDYRKERRKSTRVAMALGGTIAGPSGETFEVQTLNLSAGGVYATMPNYFPPFTKVQLAVILPQFGEEGQESPVPEDARARQTKGKDDRGKQLDPAAGSTTLQVEGIVVRCVPEGETGSHEVAIAFLHLPPAVRKQIEAYVTWRLERSLIESAGEG